MSNLQGRIQRIGKVLLSWDDPSYGTAAPHFHRVFDPDLCLT